MEKLIIATRESKLAMWQSEHIKATLEEQNPGLIVELLPMKSLGDKILDAPLAKIGGKGLFLKELEEAMYRGDAHMAVHSLKDVPTRMPEGLVLAAITEREDVRDAMMSEKYRDIDDLPQGAVVGTSSLRRQMQLSRLRPDLKIKWLRGNVNTRIRKLKEGQYDAIILAAAGINRLSLQDEVEHVYPILPDQMLPAMGQAALGLQCIDDPEVIKIVERLDDEYSRIETTIERDFVDMLEGGCQVPIGVNAFVMENDDILVKAILGMPDGAEIMTDSRIVSRDQYETVGRDMAQKMIDRGAKELLARAEAMGANQPE
ncbi:MAG: hydroxymethylbilane synthase [Epsilonproteobacteria bacterium]|nr:MAG: hydroxymethylbilane synthase [Campylobacterota bacterium]